MKVLVALVVLALLVLLVLALARAISSRTRATGRWALDESSDGELVTVLAVHPGKERLLIGSVPIAAADFAQRLEDVRAEGEEKVVALNARRALRP